MKMKPRFRIGDWVRVSAYVKFDYPNNIRTPYVQKLENPIIGQIVGARMKFLGEHVPGGYDDIAHLKVRSSLWVWLVRDGCLNKPYEVMDECVELYLTEDVHLIHKSTPILPWRKTNLNWTETEKKAYQKEMKTWPRDSKGRWTK